MGACDEKKRKAATAKDELAKAEIDRQKAEIDVDKAERDRIAADLAAAAADRLCLGALAAELPTGGFDTPVTIGACAAAVAANANLLSKLDDLEKARLELEKQELTKAQRMRELQDADGDLEHCMGGAGGFSEPPEDEEDELLQSLPEDDEGDEDGLDGGEEPDYGTSPNPDTRTSPYIESDYGQSFDLDGGYSTGGFGASQSENW